MKTFSRSFSVLSIAFFIIAALAQETSAQCVNCKAVGGAFTCVPSQNGGCQCSPVGPGSQDCVISIPCSMSIKCEQGASVATQKRAGLKIDNSTIRQIGQAHPRFATMLAAMNKAGGIKDWMQVHQVAAPIYTADVENWLKPDNEVQDFFREYHNRQVPNAEPPVYEFTLQVSDGGHSVLQGKVIKGFDGDPAATNLEIELTGGKVINWGLY